MTSAARSSCCSTGATTRTSLLKSFPRKVRFLGVSELQLRVDGVNATPSMWPSERLRASCVNGDSFAIVYVPHRTCAASATRRRGSILVRAATSSGARAAKDLGIYAGLPGNWPLRSAMGVELAVGKVICGGRRAEPHKRRRPRRRRLRLGRAGVLEGRRQLPSLWWSGPTPEYLSPGATSVESRN